MGADATVAARKNVKCYQCFGVASYFFKGVGPEFWAFLCIRVQLSMMDLNNSVACLEFGP